MINYSINEENIKSDSSILLFAFAGWPDAGQAATNALKTLSENLNANKIAEIESEDFYNFSRERPMVYTEDDKRLLKWPQNEFLFIPKIINNHDLVILNGIEPHLKWNTFSDLVINLSKKLNVELVITLGALLDAIPHTRLPKLTLTSTQTIPEKFTQKKFERASYEGPTGITSILLDKFTKINISCLSIWAHSPHYLQASPNPILSLALLNKLDSEIGIKSNLTKLNSKAAKFRARLDNAILQDNELKN
ncbi:MAG: PAC2 family protein, partial [SAR202 cluster bacterium]|nr:PAC2 family protein [SAR202 cluster bacterium]